MTKGTGTKRERKELLGTLKEAVKNVRISARQMSNRTWKYHVPSSMADVGRRGAIWRVAFFSDIYVWQPVAFLLSDRGSKENLFYHGRADRYQASNRYFPFVRRPFEPPLLPRPVEIDIDDLNLRFSFDCATLLSLSRSLFFSLILCLYRGIGTHAGYNGR